MLSFLQLFFFRRQPGRPDPDRFQEGVDVGRPEADGPPDPDRGKPSLIDHPINRHGIDGQFFGQRLDRVELICLHGFLPYIFKMAFSMSASL